MKSLVRLAKGDMRRALNVLQVGFFYLNNIVTSIAQYIVQADSHLHPHLITPCLGITKQLLTYS